MRKVFTVAVLLILAALSCVGKDADSPTSAVIVHGGHPPYWSEDLDRAVRVFRDEGYLVIPMIMPPVPHEGRPTRDFLDPVISTVDNLVDMGIENIYMVGLSGGGWTTVVACWADQRIDKCFPVAGSLPLEFSDEGWGANRDYEQLHVPVSYRELYARANFMLAFYILDDPCCFPGREVMGHDIGVAYIVDSTTDKHEISPYTLGIIMENLRKD